jgi:hypothetical protein
MHCPICWPQKLRYFLHTLVLCTAIAGVQYLFNPTQGFEFPLVYSLCIGVLSWALIDFGRHAFPSSAATGWPQGWLGFVLPLGGVALAYVPGHLLGDAWFGQAFGERNPLSLSTPIIITAISGTVINFYFYAHSHALHLKRGAQEAQQQATEARLRLLESQLEPHMLFNTLANLRVLIGSDPARAQAMLDHLNAYLRATLSATRSGGGQHTLAKEFERLQDYLELMAVRMGSRLHYTLDLPDDLRTLPLPALLLQPLVENSIRHGLEPQVQGGSIAVRASRTGNLVSLEVSDTGTGFPQDAAQPNGFGVAHVHERLASTYPGVGSLVFEHAPQGGTRAVVTLPA